MNTEYCPDCDDTIDDCNATGTCLQSATARCGLCKELHPAMWVKNGICNTCRCEED